MSTDSLTLNRQGEYNADGMACKMRRTLLRLSFSPFTYICSCRTDSLLTRPSDAPCASRLAAPVLAAPVL